MKKQKAEISILVFSLLLSSCSRLKQQEIEDSGKGTLCEVTNEAGLALDNLGNPIEVVRDIKEKYPDMASYTGQDKYENIYIPILGKEYNKSKWTVVEHNVSFTTIRNRVLPDATYTFGRIADIRPADDSNYAVFSTISPLTEVCRMKDGEPEMIENLYCEVLSSQDERINGHPAQGYRFKSISKYDYVPAYSYMIFRHTDDDAIYEMMVTDNVKEDAKSKDKLCEPLDLYVLDTRNNPNHQSILEQAESPSKIEYKVYCDEITMAVPSFMEIYKGNSAFRVRERDGECTPFVGAGATVVYVDGMLDTKEQIMLLIEELQNISDNSTKLESDSLKFEENLQFLGSDGATCLHGNLFIREGGLDARKELCGTGKIVFNIYQVHRGDRIILAMFYCGEDQEDLFREWIKYNCY